MDTQQIVGYLILLLAISTISSAPAQSQSVAINYGTVESVATVQQDAQHAGGAVAGGLVGALIGGPRHRGLRVLTGAAVGAAVQGSHTSGTLQLYSVTLVSGGFVQVTTEQTDIRIGDCVRVEQGQYSNIVRTGSVHCESGGYADTSPPAHHVQMSQECDAAKQELGAAESNEAVDLAIKKVRVLCET